MKEATGVPGKTPTNPKSLANVLCAPARIQNWAGVRDSEQSVAMSRPLGHAQTYILWGLVLEVINVNSNVLHQKK